MNYVISLKKTLGRVLKVQLLLYEQLLFSTIFHFLSPQSWAKSNKMARFMQLILSLSIYFFLFTCLSLGFFLKKIGLNYELLIL